MFVNEKLIIKHGYVTLLFSRVVRFSGLLHIDNETISSDIKITYICF